MQERLGGEMIKKLRGHTNWGNNLFLWAKPRYSSPTHILQNSSPCIDLIVTNLPSLVVDSGVHPSLHTNCHHQLTFKTDLKNRIPFTLRTISVGLKSTDSEAINKAIEGFNWNKSFWNIDIDGKVHLFNKSVIKICKNYISNKIVTFSDKDTPWQNNHIRLLIKTKNASFQKYLKDARANLQASKAELTDAINLSKIMY